MWNENCGTHQRCRSPEQGDASSRFVSVSNARLAQKVRAYALCASLFAGYSAVYTGSFFGNVAQAESASTYHYFGGVAKDLDRAIPKPPEKDSAADKEDIVRLLKFQKTRT